MKEDREEEEEEETKWKFTIYENRIRRNFLIVM
jgi:hypothetical protein